MAFDFPSSPTTGQQFTPVAGVTYTYNGYGWDLLAGPGPGLAVRQVIIPFLASGTWTRQPGLIGIVAEVWGAGGCGAAAITSAGGSGGGYARKWYPASALPATVTVTVGLGVTSGNGQDTTFAATSPIVGGGGKSSSVGSPPVGQGSGGDINLNGGMGKNGVSGVLTGAGGASPFIGITNENSGGADVGVANTGQGGCSGAVSVGAAGGSGLCIITEYYAVAGATALPGQPVLIQSQTVTAGAATLDFTTGIDATYDEYEIRVYNWKPTADAGLWMRVSQDGGATFKSTATDYFYAMRLTAQTSVEAQAQAAQIAFAQAQSSSAGALPLSGTIRFYTPSSTVNKKAFIWDFAQQGATGSIGRVTGAGDYQADANAINAIRFLLNVSTHAQGTFTLYGIKK